MPTRPVRKNGKIVGYRWGKSGKLYRTKAKADAQGRAIYASGYKKKGNYGFRVIRKRRRDGHVQRYYIKTKQPKTVKDIHREETITEPKYDGSRTVLIKEGGKLYFVNRRNIIKNTQYPELLDIGKNITGDVVLDGEVVALDKKHPYGNFHKLAQRDNLKDPDKIKDRANRIPLTYVVFDIVSKGRKDISKSPLLKRKQILDSVVTQGPRIQEIKYSNKPDTIIKNVKSAQGEGVVLKGIHGKYSDPNSRDWEKLKFSKENDVAIVGFTEGTGKRKPSFGALRMAVHTPKGLIDVGKVGSGFTDKDLKEIRKRLNKGEKLVARVSYRKVGSQGRYIEPKFVGLRSDIDQKQTHR